MSKYKVISPDGQELIIEADSPEAARAKAQAQVKNTNPGVDPNAPPEMLLDPKTGAYRSPELMENWEQPSAAESAGVGAYQGLSFGGGDEFMGAMNAAIPGPGTAAERYTYGREHMRAKEAAARRDHPYMTGAGEIAGGVTTALSYGLPAATRLGLKGLGGAVASNSIVGGAEGLTYGALSGEGGRDRIVKALQGAGIGVSLGAAAPVATSAAKGLWNMGADVVGGGVDALVGRGRQGKAYRAILATLNRSGKSADDIGDDLMRAAQEGQSEYRLMDALGDAGERRVAGITRSGGDASAELADFLKQRQIDQADRMGGIVSDAFDGSQSAAQKKAGLDAARTAEANINYPAARGNAGPVDLGPALEGIDDALRGVNSLDGGKTGLAETAVGRKLAAVRKQLESGDLATIDFDQVLETKQELGRAIEAIKNRREKVPPAISRVYGELDAALENSSDLYRTANDKFREASGVIDAVDAGADMTKPGSRATDNVDRLAQMSPDQVAAARVGYGDKLLGRIEGATDGTNAARPYTKTKTQQEVAALAKNPDLFSRQVGRENKMFDTMYAGLGGSRTADNQEAIADLAGFDAGVIGNLLSGRFGEAGRNVLAKSGSVMTGASPETRRIIAQALMSNSADPVKAALAQAQTSEARKEIVDILLRVGGQKMVGSMQ